MESELDTQNTVVSSHKTTLSKGEKGLGKENTLFFLPSSFLIHGTEKRVREWK